MLGTGKQDTYKDLGTRYMLGTGKQDTYKDLGTRYMLGTGEQGTRNSGMMYIIIKNWVMYIRTWVLLKDLSVFLIYH